MYDPPSSANEALHPDRAAKLDLGVWGFVLSGVRLQPEGTSVYAVLSSSTSDNDICPVEGLTGAWSGMSRACATMSAR